MYRLLHDRLLLASAILILSVGSIATHGALTGVGEIFPGFLVLENRVVASVGLSIWPATQGGEIYQLQVVEMNGTAVKHADELTAAVREMQPGTPVEYRFVGSQRGLVRKIETRRFGAADFMLLHGLYLLNGLALGAAALTGIAVRRRNPSALAVVPLVLVGSLWSLSAMDLYGPFRLFRLHAGSEALLCAAATHMALCFPCRARILRDRPWLLTLVWMAGGTLALVYELGLYDRETYTKTHLLAITAFGSGLLALVVSELEHYRRPVSAEVRERVRVMAHAAVLALALPITLTLAELATGGRSPQNALALTGFVFPLAIAYALVRKDFAGPSGLDRDPPLALLVR